MRAAARGVVACCAFLTFFSSLGFTAERFTSEGFTSVLGTRIASAQSPPPAPTTIALGDFQLSPTFEARLRGEYRRDAPDLGGLDFAGRSFPRVRDAWVISERARLGLGVERGPVSAKITLQDARPFGTHAPTATVSDLRGRGRFEPYEAWIEMRSSGARPNSLRLGRQPLVWGEGRLIGVADFSPTGRALDAVRGHVSTGNFDFEALAAILETPTPLGAAWEDRSGPASMGVQLYGLSAGLTLDPLLRIEAFALARISRSSGLDADGSRFRTARREGETYTASLRISGDDRGVTYGVEGAYQLGRAIPLAPGGADVAAYAFAGHVAKTLPAIVLTPTFRIGASYASGDDGGGTYRQFDPLLADPQRFHGQMDLFAWSNMLDASARAQIVPWTDTTFGLEYRYARLAEASGEWIGSYLTAIGRAVRPASTGPLPTAQTPTPDQELGHELDAVFTWKPWVPLDLRLGWSALFLGDGARAVMTAHARGALAQGVLTTATIAQYTYIQATLTMP